MKSVAFSVGTGLLLLMLAVICIVDSVPLADNESNKLAVVSSSSSSSSDSVENRPKRDAKNGQHSFSDYPFRGIRYRMPNTKKSYDPIDDSSSSVVEDVDDDVMLRTRRGTYSRKSSFSTRPLYGRNGAVVARSARSFSKRSSHNNNVDDEDDEPEDVEEFISMLSEQLHRQDNSNDADEEDDDTEDNGEESESDMDKLADSVALAILLDELAAEEEKTSSDKMSHLISQMKKKKKSSSSSSSLKRGDKKKKRTSKKRSMASFMDRLIAEAPVELTENDIDKELLIDLAAMLAEEGLEQDEIEAILTQLVATAFSEGKDMNKKKRSGEWRKLPRGAVRWRSGLHSQDNDANEWHQSSTSIHHRDGPDDESAFSEGGKFFGRGFHRRLGNGETFSAPPEEKSAKRVPLHLHSMKTKNAVTHFNHRNSLLGDSESSNEANQQQLSEEPMEMQHATQAMKRMKRSSSSSSSKEADAFKQASVNGTAALPPVINASSVSVSSKDQNEANKQQEKHNAVIRKKSVDWDDYFGFDKKKKKRGNNIQDDDDDDEIDQQSEEDSMRNFLDSQYYKSIASALAYRRKRGGAHEHDNGMMKKRKVAGINNQTHHHHEQQQQQQQQPHANSKFDVSSSSSDVNDAEDAMNAALRAMQQSAQHSQSYDIDRMRAELLTELVDKLEADDLDEMTRRLALQLIQAIDDEEESGDDNGDDDVNQDSEKNIDDAKHKQRYLKRSVNAAIAAHKKSGSAARRLPSSFEADDANDCTVVEQVVTTCNMVSHLYVGYRPVLSDACFRHQACAICSDNEAACDVEYQQRAIKVCGSDLLCQSQSRHLLTALRELNEGLQIEYLQRNELAHIKALCHRDSCLADFWKRR